MSAELWVQVPMRAYETQMGSYAHLSTGPGRRVLCGGGRAVGTALSSARVSTAGPQENRIELCRSCSGLAQAAQRERNG